MQSARKERQQGGISQPDQKHPSGFELGHAFEARRQVDPSYRRQPDIDGTHRKQKASAQPAQGR